MAVMGSQYGREVLGPGVRSSPPSRLLTSVHTSCWLSRVNAFLTREVGWDRVQRHRLAGIALQHKAISAGQAPTTSDVHHSEGNYQSYIEDLKKRKGPDADQPHRVAYKKLVRA